MSEDPVRSSHQIIVHHLVFADCISSRSHHQLQEQAEHFMVSIESEKRAIDTVAEQTGLMKHKILHQRKMMGGVNAAKENEYMVQKQVWHKLDITLSRLRSGQSTGE